jgi:NAD(P)H-dependent FMN reductase
MSKNIKLIISSTRQGRNGQPVADWLVKTASESGIDISILDLSEINLPLLDSAISPAYAPVDTDEAKAWSKEISESDGIVFLTAEYNRSIPAPLKNAIDYLYPEWDSKKSVIVSYGFVDGGSSATNHLVDILSWVKADIINPKVAIKFERDTFNEQYQFADIDKTLGAYKNDFIEALKQI